MTGRPDSAIARLVCTRCGHNCNICVPVRLGIPPTLRCVHTDHGGVEKDAGGDILCPQCRCQWHIGGDTLSRAVEDAMQRTMTQWIQVGAVVIPCGDR